MLSLKEAWLAWYATIPVCSIHFLKLLLKPWDCSINLRCIWELGPHRGRVVFIVWEIKNTRRLCSRIMNTSLPYLSSAWCSPNVAQRWCWILWLNAECISEPSSLAYNWTPSSGLRICFLPFPTASTAQSASLTALSGPGVSPVYIHKHLPMRESSNLPFFHNSFNAWPITAVCSLICCCKTWLTTSDWIRWAQGEAAGSGMFQLVWRCVAEMSVSFI